MKLYLAATEQHLQTELHPETDEPRVPSLSRAHYTTRPRVCCDYLANQAPFAVTSAQTAAGFKIKNIFTVSFLVGSQSYRYFHQHRGQG